MYKTIVLIVLLTIVASSYSLPPPNFPGGSICPVFQAGGSIFTSQVVASSNGQGQIGLVQGTDVQEFSYSFQTTYSSRPGIAVAVNGFSSRPSEDLFFSIKPVMHPNNFSSVVFVVKTTWCKTSWTQLKFNFLVEDRTDIEAGYYLLGKD